MSSRSASSAGFTVIELLVVIVTLGIIVAVAAPRFLSDRAFLERGYYDELAAALKYAQKLAVASGCPVRFEIKATSYEARQNAANGACSSPDAAWTDGAGLAGELLSGASPLGVSTSPATMVFDALGKPNLGADLSISVGRFSLSIKTDGGFFEEP